MRAPSGLTSRLSRRERRWAAIIASGARPIVVDPPPPPSRPDTLGRASTIGVSGVALSVSRSASPAPRAMPPCPPTMKNFARRTSVGAGPVAPGRAPLRARVVKPSQAAARAAGSRVGCLARSDRVPSDGGVRGSGAGRFRGHTPLQVSLRETCERRPAGSGRYVGADRQRRP